MGTPTNEMSLIMSLIRAISKKLNGIDKKNIKKSQYFAGPTAFFVHDIINDIMNSIYDINYIINDIEQLCHKSDGLLVTNEEIDRQVAVTGPLGLCCSM